MQGQAATYVQLHKDPRSINFFTGCYSTVSILCSYLSGIQSQVYIIPVGGTCLY